MPWVAPRFDPRWGRPRRPRPKKLCSTTSPSEFASGAKWSRSYPDATRGVPKTAESRGTESILNALILSRYAAQARGLDADTQRALDNMWALQVKEGGQKGAWIWLNFHNAPWEGEDSQYWGTSLAAIAVGLAPGNYRSNPAIQENVKALGDYLRQNLAAQPLVNRLFCFVRGFDSARFADSPPKESHRRRRAQSPGKRRRLEPLHHDRNLEAKRWNGARIEE